MLQINLERGRYAFGCRGVDGKYFIITELRALDWPATVLRVNVFPTFFDLLRQGDSPVKACIEMQRIRYYALARIRAPISRNGCVHANERMCWLRETERLALFRVALLRCVIGYFMQRVKTLAPQRF